MSVGVANWRAARLFPGKSRVMWKSLGEPQVYSGDKTAGHPGPTQVAIDFQPDWV